MEGGALRPQDEAVLEGSQRGQEGRGLGGSGLLKPGVGGSGLTQEHLSQVCPRCAPGLGGRDRYPSPRETVLDQVAVPTPWPGSQGT